MTKLTEEDVEISDYYRMLKNNWELALGIFVLIMAVAVFYTFLTPKVYQARSLVMITSQDQTAYLLGSSFSSLPRTDIETEKAIIMSGSVLGPVYVVPETAKYQISAEAIKNSNVIEIKVESKNSFTAMRVANRVAESYVNYSRESKKQAALDVNQFISEQLTTYKAELDLLNMKILEYKNKKNLTNMTIEQQIDYQGLQQMLAAKNKLYDYLLSRTEEISIVAQEKGGNIRIIENAAIPSYPVKPNVLLNLILGFVLACIISLGVVFVKENLKEKR